jgi:hypothetical protein
VVLIWAVTEGYANKILLKNMAQWRDTFLSYLSTQSAGQKLVALIEKDGALTDGVLAALKSVSSAQEEASSHLYAVESE